jgi:ParE toxin of type II toxin-antitoxin system, parDE
VTDSADTPAPYRVVYSGVVFVTLRDFTARAQAAGQSDRFLAALKDLERRLRVYPQFGEPELDLKQEDGRLYHATVPPLVLRYAVFEERRLVFVGSPPKLLPNAGF